MMKHPVLIGLLIALCGCAATPDPCDNLDIRVGMPASQVTPMLRQCGKLTGEGVGFSTWLLRDRVIGVTEKQGVVSIGYFH